MKKITLVFFIAQILVHSIFAQTWTGVTSTDWNNAGNWASPASVPAAAGNVVIPGSVASNRWPALSTDVTINSITTNPGCQLNVNGHILNIVSSNVYNYIQGGTINNTNAGTDIVININTGTAGYISYVKNTTFNDHVVFNITGSNTFYDDDAGSGNIFSGNATFNIGGGMQVYISQGAVTQFGGNLVVNRTVAGLTQMFNAGGSVTGNFNYTNNTAGDTYIGILGARSSVGGTVTIAANYTTPNIFQVYRLVNQTTGGTITVQNSRGFDIQLDTLKVNTFSVTGYTGSNYAYLLGNSITGNITISDDASYSSGYGTFIRNNVFTGSFSVTIKGTNNLNEADLAGSSNIYNGNAIFNAQGTGAFYMSHGAMSTHNGSLSITRTAAGQTQVFNAGGSVTGNFSFTNLVNGNSYFGNTTIRTLITGTINMQVKNSSPGDFLLYHVINQTGGGTISLDSTKAFDFRSDTLLLSNLNCLKYYGSAYAYLLNNSIIASINIADDISYQSGYYTQVRNNIFTGNTSFTERGTNAIYEADAVGTGNIFNGNTSFTLAGSGPLYISHGSPTAFNGNLTITRSGGGQTQAFNASGSVTGNFSYTNPVNGNSYFGNSTTPTQINGTINVQVKNSLPGDFTMYRITNKTPGGSISLDSTKAFDFRNDTLLLVNMTCLQYYGSAYAYLLNNSITATVNIADDISYQSGYYTQIRNNIFTGNASFTDRGTNAIYEADAAGTGNIFNGNTSFTIAGSGSLYTSQGSPTAFNGNLTITRTGGGQTLAFNAGGTVTGNFSYSNLVNGNSIFGNATTPTQITGTINVQVKNGSPGDFAMLRVRNQTNGGSISLDSTKPVNFQNDTLLLNNFSCQHYYGSAYAYLLSNSITGAITVSDDIAYGGGYFLQVRNNVFNGNSSFTHKGINNIMEADAGGTGNIFNGNTSFTMQGSGSLYASHGASSQFNGNLLITRNTTAGLMQVFNTAGAVSGNFTYSNNIGGSCIIGNTNATTPVNGQVNIAVTHSSPTDMVIQRIKNLAPGGAINILNTKPFDIRLDTLVVTQLSVTGFRGNAYAYLLNNKITGDVTIADDVSYGGGYATYIRGNMFIGNTSITNNGNNGMYSSDSDPLGNKYAGNAIFTKTGSGPLFVGQNNTDEVDQNFTMTGSGGISIGNLSFAGGINGTITKGGTLPITISNLFLKKTGNAIVTLNDSVQVAISAVFTSGYIIASQNKELIFLNGATQTGATDTGHVQGPVSKIGSQAFVFPVGNGQAIQTAAISAPANTSDRFRVEYFAGSPHPTYDTSKRAATLNNVSGAQYWQIDRLAGASNVFVTLEYGPPRGIAITANQADYRVAHWTGSSWADLGNGANTGTIFAGTVQTAAAVASFSPFTIAAISGIDPLSNTPGALSPACANSPLTVNFKSSGVFNAGNVFTAQLSNSSGSFASPLNIGTLAVVPNGLNVANVINTYLPSSAIPTGSGYRVRVVSNNPVQAGSSNTSNITINSVYIGPDTTVALSCLGSTVSLLPLYNTTGLTANWNTGNPAAAPSGTYRLDVINGLGCKDTAIAIVNLKVATWTGTVSNNWHLAGNWSTNQIPDDKTHVIVSATAPNPCVVSTANALAASVQVVNGATLNTINGKQLIISGNCTTLPPH